MNALRLTRQNLLPYGFALLWILTTLFLAWLLVNRQTLYGSIGLWAAILTAIPCNVALMNVLKNPIYAEPTEHPTAKGKLAGWVVIEEAWARFMFVPLAFLLFRRVSSNRTAFSTALIVMACLFAFMHTPGSGGAGNMLLGTLIGIIFILPIPVICFYRDLETAIGFHFWMDFVKFLVALVLING